MLSTLLVAAAAALMATGYEARSRGRNARRSTENSNGNLGSEGDAVHHWQGWWYDEIC